MPSEIESYRYKQSATYKHVEALYILGALKSWAVNEKAYRIVNQAIVLLNHLNSFDFAEDENGNIIKEKLLTSKPDWKN